MLLPFNENDKFLSNFKLHILQLISFVGKGQSMGEIIDINGITYKVKHGADKFTLQRYNEKHKMWVNLHFPKGNGAEGKKIQEDVIQILSNLYIERNAIANVSME